MMGNLGLWHTYLNYDKQRAQEWQHQKAEREASVAAANKKTSRK